MSQKTLLNYSHSQLKAAITRLLRNRRANGGRGSIKRSRLQPELAKAEKCAAVLGNPRKAVEANLNKAIAALRSEKSPRIEKNRGDEMIRLVK